MLQHTSRPCGSIVKNDVLRWLLLCCGWVSIACGVLGLFLPLLPTVPFLLLAAACFARSSPRFHSWLVEHDHLGPLIRDYLKSGEMPLRAKRVALGMIWISIPGSAFLFVNNDWLRMLMLGVAAAVSLYLVSLPTAASIKTDRTAAGEK